MRKTGISRYDVDQIAAIEIQNLRHYTWAERKQIPKTTGIYFIFLEGKVVYIGQACRIRDRFADHTIIKPYRTDPTLRLAYIEMGERWQQVPPEALFLAEHYFIKKYKPSMNQTSPCSPWGVYGRYFSQCAIGRELLANYRHQIHEQL